MVEKVASHIRKGNIFEEIAISSFVTVAGELINGTEQARKNPAKYVEITYANGRTPNKTVFVSIGYVPNKEYKEQKIKEAVKIPDSFTFPVYFFKFFEEVQNAPEHTAETLFLLDEDARILKCSCIKIYRGGDEKTERFIEYNVPFRERDIEKIRTTLENVRKKKFSQKEVLIVPLRLQYNSYSD